jgi:hypothetical protein
MKKMRTYNEDVWNPWTELSELIPFESEVTYIGAGERKLAAEFDTIPLGQNETCDLEINNERWQVKKLDVDGSFRLGVDILPEYNNLLSRLFGCSETLVGAQEYLLSARFREQISRILNDLNQTWGTARIAILAGLYRGEVGEENLNKLSELLEELKEIIFFIDDTTIELYSSYDGKRYPYTPTDAIIKIQRENITTKQKVEILGGVESFDRSFLKSQIQPHLVFLQHTTLNEYLNTMVRRVFNELRLVLVHKTYGFMPISAANIENVYCYRITSGSPRCRLQVP